MRRNSKQEELLSVIEADLFNNHFELASEEEIMAKMHQPLSISYFNNLEAIERDDLGDLPLECFLIKDRGLKALNDIGILTLADLAIINDYVEKSPNGIERIGGTVHRVIQQQFDYFISNRGKISLTKFKDDYLDAKQRNVLDLRNGLAGERHTLEEVSAEYNVTRERIRQIEKKALERMRRGVQYGLVDTRVRDILYHCADRSTPLSEIPDLLADYHKEGLVYLYSAILPKELMVYKSDYLNESLLIRSQNREYFDKQIQDIRKYLNEQVELVSVGVVQDLFQGSRDLIMRLTGIVIKDNQVALSTNKRALGVSKVHNIIGVLREAGRPLSIEEIAVATHYEYGSVRGVVFHSQEIVNVGQSIYALKEQGYFNFDTDGMMKYILKEKGVPILTNELIGLVKGYRKVTDGAVYRILAERPEDFQQLEGGYVALREWGYENEADRSTRYYLVAVTDAILKVLEEAEVPLSQNEITMSMEMMFGDETSLNPKTIYAALKRLDEEGAIEKTSDGRAAYYELM